jgi:hypothetical protein
MLCVSLNLSDAPMNPEYLLAIIAAATTILCVFAFAADASCE